MGLSPYEIRDIPQIAVLRGTVMYSDDNYPPIATLSRENDENSWEFIGTAGRWGWPIFRPSQIWFCIMIRIDRWIDDRCIDGQIGRYVDT